MDSSQLKQIAIAMCYEIVFINDVGVTVRDKNGTNRFYRPEGNAEQAGEVVTHLLSKGYFVHFEPSSDGDVNCDIESGWADKEGKPISFYALTGKTWKSAVVAALWEIIKDD